MPEQLGLFAPEPIIEPALRDQDAELATRVPAFVHFGTSSWSFPGWAGLVWRGRPSEADLARGGLEAYAKQPLFRAVGLDRTYYAPLRADEIDRYGASLARAARPCFRVLPKVWDELTSAVFPKHPRYGARAGQLNPRFLDAATFRSEVLAPFAAAPWATPFVFELTPMPAGTFEERDFIARIETFIDALPSDRRWAFELRNAELFGRRWLDLCRSAGVAHVLNHWTAMPSLAKQLSLGGLTAPFTVVRLMLPPFGRYDALRARFAPFDKLLAPSQEMRDDVLAILRAVADRGGHDAFVLVNNKAEGSAPLTVRALAERTARELGP